MAGSELAFEQLAYVPEVARGTAVTPPTHGLNMTGQITPIAEFYDPEDQLGVLAETAREEIVRTSSEWEGEGAADIYKLPTLLNMAMDAETAGVLTGGEVTSTTSLVGGTGYVPATQTDAFTIGVGAPAAGGRQAVIYATTAAGIITSLRIADPGSHYTSAPALTFTGHTGTGASATAVVSTTGTLAYLWEWIRAMTSDTLISGTLYWGDLNNVVYKAAFAMLQELSLSADASSTDGVTMSAKGIANTATELIGGAIPAMPAVSVSPLLVPMATQVWMETATTTPFGTTAITGRVISAEVTIPTGVEPKYVAVGPTGGLTYARVGRKKTRPEIKIAMELVDTTQTALFLAGTTVKLRVRFNNRTAIESTSYPFVEFDIQGKLRDLSWTDLEGTNRAVEFTIKGVYSTQLASDLRARIQSPTGTL